MKCIAVKKSQTQCDGVRLHGGKEENKKYMEFSLHIVQRT